MAVKVIDGIVHYKKEDYKENDIIEKIDKNEEERLIKLDVVVHVDMIETPKGDKETGPDKANDGKK